MALDKTTLWEAFASGGWTGEQSELSEAGTTDIPYTDRIKSFYDYVVGPSFGYDWGGQLFGSAFGGEGETEAFYGVGSEREAMDTAERAFRQSIGDPYGADDPFSWQNISRYKTYEFDTGEAQKLLEGELYDQGEFLGGEHGSEYAVSMDRQTEAYTTGMGGQREALTHGTLTAGVGLASGTSGATLRSGAAVGRAEDILTETYLEAKSLGAGYVEGKETTEIELRRNLDDALDVYLTAIDTAKESWYQGILGDVHRIQGYSGDPTDPNYQSAFGGVQEEFPEADWGGLTYEGELAEQGIKGTEEVEGYDFRADGACGIGELWLPNDPEDPTQGSSCQPMSPELAENVYGQLYGTGEGHYAAQGCTDAGACNPTPGAKIDDGTCEYESCKDQCGVMFGDDSTCLDECGVPNGSGADAGYDCDGNCIIGEDCNGECGGSAVVDECGECGGSGIADGACDCAGSIEDECGECGGNGSSCADCEGTPNGSATVDECGVCNGMGKWFACWDGEMACSEEECSAGPEIDECGVEDGPGRQYECPDGTLQCSEADCGVIDPTGSEMAETSQMCPEGEHLISFFGYTACWPDQVAFSEDPCPAGQALAPNGVDCVDEDLVGPDIDLCEDGTERPQNGVCPEDTEAAGGDCPCVGVEEFNDKLCIPPGGEGSYDDSMYANPNCYVTVFRHNCPDNPSLHGAPCGTGPGHAPTSGAFGAF